MDVKVMAAAAAIRAGLPNDCMKVGGCINCGIDGCSEGLLDLTVIMMVLIGP